MVVAVGASDPFAGPNQETLATIVQIGEAVGELNAAVVADEGGNWRMTEDSGKSWKALESRGEGAATAVAGGWEPASHGRR